MSQTSYAPPIRPGPDGEASRLYAEYHDKILRYCVGQLRSREEAEDAVQNTFLRVVAALRKGVVPEFEGPWLYKIAHNVCLSRRLSWSRRARVEVAADVDSLGEKAAAYSPDADELFGLGDALADMPANLRRPLLMREWQGMSYLEIAEALGVSHSAVETLIFRARRHLAQALTDSVRKTGRAVASIFNLRWLLDALKDLGGGAGGAGMLAGAAGLVVAIGAGVTIELVTQHAAASHAAVANRPTAAAASGTAPPGAGAANGGARTSARAGAVAAPRARGGAARRGGGTSGTRTGGPPSAGAASASAGVSAFAATAAGSPAASSPPSSAATSTASGSGSGSGSPVARAAGKKVSKPAKQSQPGLPAASLPGLPSIPNPGGAVPPVSPPSVPSVPSVPTVPAPPAVSVPSVPPVPPVPPVAPAPPVAPVPPPVPPVPPVAPPPLPPVPPVPPVGTPAGGALP